MNTVKNTSNLRVFLAIGAVVALGGVLQFGVFPKYFPSLEASGTAKASSPSAPNLAADDAPSAAGGSSKKVPIPYLNCSSMKERSQEIFRNHYQFHDFNAEISSRSFKKFFESLDPAKLYLLESDIEKFKSFEKTLGEKLRNNDCTFMADAHKVLLKRMKESQAIVEEIFKTPFDFSVDESVETDRRKVTWAKDPAEAKERLRKNLKFMAMNQKEVESDDQKIAQRILKRLARTMKTVEERSSDDVNAIYLNALTAALDPHSAYMPPEENEEFKIDFALQLVGIGATLANQDGYTVVEALIPGGAASRDGRLQPQDKIIQVDSGDGNGYIDVIDMELNKVVQLIRGKKDTTVRLVVLRPQPDGSTQKILISLVRDVVHLKSSEASSGVMDVGGKKIGVLNLPQFYFDYQGCRKNFDSCRMSSRDTLREINKLKAQKIDGLILDLRSNGGGDLSEGIRISGLFIKRGPVVQIEDKDHKVEVKDDENEGVAWTGPMAVLVSKASASASEIFTNAMKDYGRALVIGDSRTYGKATVQSVLDIDGTNGRDSDGALRVTIAKFYSPAGRSNQEKGVASDVVVPSALEATDIGEEENDYVIPWSTIAPAPSFKPIQDLKSLFSTLQEKSNARQKSSKEFGELLAEIEKAKKKNGSQLSLKIEKKSPTPTATPTEKPKTDVSEAFNPIRPKDFQLKEVAQVLIDAIGLKPKSDWMSP